MFYYFAYGSNLNNIQMKRRCPNCRFVKKITLKNYSLTFRSKYGAADIEKKMAMLPNKASLIFNPSSAAPGFIVENVFCLPGVPSILKSMLGGLNDKIVGGKQILNKTINLRTVESEIAGSLEKVQKRFHQVEIGSYPFFRSGKVGVSIVIRSTEPNPIKDCATQIQSFIKQKKIKILGTE